MKEDESSLTIGGPFMGFLMSSRAPEIFADRIRISPIGIYNKDVVRDVHIHINVL